MTALTHYSQGLAYAATERAGNTDQEREGFRAMVLRVPASGRCSTTHTRAS